MNQYGSIVDIHAELERSASEYEYVSNIGDVFKTFFSGNPQLPKMEAHNCSTEQLVFGFQLQNGQLSPMFSGTKNESEEWAWPDLGDFDQNRLDYLKSRCSGSTNPILRSRYAHILWEHRSSKNRQFAEIAVDAYIDSAGIYEQNQNRRAMIECIEAACVLAANAKYRVDSVVEKVRQVLGTVINCGDDGIRIIYDLGELIIQHRQEFTDTDLKNAVATCDDLAKKLEIDSLYDQAVSVLEIGEKIGKKLRRAQGTWRHRIANIREEQMKRSLGGDKLRALLYCNEAMDSYGKAGDKAKVCELQSIRDSLGRELPLESFSREVDITETVGAVQEIAERVASLRTDEIIPILACDPDILPSHSVMIEAVRNQAKQAPLSCMCSSTVLDQRGNVVQVTEAEEERQAYAIIQNYGNYLKFQHVHLINAIFELTIRQGKLSAPALIAFLLNNSWLGKTREKSTPDGLKHSYRWTSLLAPGLFEYFFKIDLWLRHPRWRPNLVLCVETLVLKIEGILRDLLESHGGVTTYSKLDHKGRQVSREKDTRLLLADPDLERIVGKDDILFLKFLLVEQSGMNLRHKIAHSLMLPEDYSAPAANLLLLAVMRLSRWKLVPNPDSRA
jgi:hypothetical protein